MLIINFFSPHHPPAGCRIARIPGEPSNGFDNNLIQLKKSIIELKRSTAIFTPGSRLGDRSTFGDSPNPPIGISAMQKCTDAAWGRRACGYLLKNLN